jgi:hypothetical protein
VKPTDKIKLIRDEDDEDEDEQNITMNVAVWSGDIYEVLCARSGVVLHTRTLLLLIYIDVICLICSSFASCHFCSPRSII